jgi:hypothetical protein
VDDFCGFEIDAPTEIVAAEADHRDEQPGLPDFVVSPSITRRPRRFRRGRQLVAATELGTSTGVLRPAVPGW